MFTLLAKKDNIDFELGIFYTIEQLEEAVKKWKSGNPTAFDMYYYWDDCKRFKV